MTPARTNLFDRLVGWSLANRLFVLAAALALLVAGPSGCSACRWMSSPTSTSPP